MYIKVPNVSKIPNSENINAPVNQQEYRPYSPRTCGGGFFQYGLTMSIIFICSLFFVGGNDQTFSKFFFAFLKSDKYHISTNLASWGIILYWFSYSVCIRISK